MKPEKRRQYERAVTRIRATSLVNGVPHKGCPECGATKPIDDFGLRIHAGKGPEGRDLITVQSWCVPCRKRSSVLRDAVSFLMTSTPRRAHLHYMKEMLFLADWKASIDYGKQLTLIQWKARSGRPEPDIEIPESHKMVTILSKRDRDVLAHVAAVASSEGLSLIDLAGSTYPFLVSTAPVRNLDLPKLAKAYKRELAGL